jgi:hypothetical protein
VKFRGGISKRLVVQGGLVKLSLINNNNKKFKKKREMILLEHQHEKEYKIREKGKKDISKQLK